MERIMNTSQISQKAEGLGPWFQNLDLKGVRTAPAHFLGDYPADKFSRFSHLVPADLTGKSVLDIGCNAGFYSFEMRRRGAARVLGIDTDARYLAQARFADLDGDPAWRHWNAARGTAPTPGGETMAAAVSRAVAHLDRLARHGDGPILCVSHCDVIRGVIAHALGLPLDNILRFEIDPASVSWVMAHGQGIGHVLTINGRE